MVDAWIRIFLFGLFASSSISLVHGQSGVDYFVLTSIEIPTINPNQDIVADINAKNIKGVGLGQAYLNVTIRDKQGVANPVFNNLTVSIPFNSIVGEIVTTRLIIQQASSANPFLVVGETYTLMAKVVPAAGETVIGNNTATKTFSVVNPPKTFPIPDMSMSVVGLTFFIVLGWLYLSQNKK